MVTKKNKLHLYYMNQKKIVNLYLKNMRVSAKENGSEEVVMRFHSNKNSNYIINK